MYNEYKRAEDRIRLLNAKHVLFIYRTLYNMISGPKYVVCDRVFFTPYLQIFFLCLTWDVFLRVCFVFSILLIFFFYFQ